MTFDLCFAICTHRRNVLLQAALDSVIAAERPRGFSFEVVVVDNSDAGEAAPVIAGAAVRAARGRHPIAIRALAAHPANISIARNAARAAAAAPWFAFLDDDQTIAADWFVESKRAINQATADVLFGAIAPRFEAPELGQGSARRLFTRDLDVAEGAPLFAFGPRKTRDLALTPGNALFRYQTTLSEAAFDAAFGLAGGEDFDLFCRLQKARRTFAWRPSLRAFETVPAARCAPDYLRRRFYAGGQVYAAAVAGLSPRPTLARWGIRARALAQGLQLGPATAAASLRGREARDEASYRWAGVLGKLSLGAPHPLYQERRAQLLLTKI